MFGNGSFLWLNREAPPYGENDTLLLEREWLSGGV